MCATPNNLVVQGKRFSIAYAVRSDETMLAKQFFGDLSDRAKDRMMATFWHVADNGEKGISPGVFKHERDDIWAFKCKMDQQLIRFPCFRINDRWFLTHGFAKILSKSAWPEQEFTLAFAIRDEVISQVKGTR